MPPKRYVAYLSLGIFTALSPVAEAASFDAPSASQQSFIDKYGYPQLFTVSFNVKDINERTRKWERLPSPERDDLWFYIDRGVAVAFHDGRQMKSPRSFDAAKVRKLLPGTTLRPFDFKIGTKKSAIQSRFGLPKDVESVPLGSHKLECYRYRATGVEPKSFTFLDGELVGVSAGFVVVKTPS